MFMPIRAQSHDPSIYFALQLTSSTPSLTSQYYLHVFYSIQFHAACLRKSTYPTRQAYQSIPVQSSPTPPLINFAPLSLEPPKITFLPISPTHTCEL